MCDMGIALSSGTGQLAEVSGVGAVGCREQ